MNKKRVLAYCILLSTFYSTGNIYGNEEVLSVHSGIVAQSIEMKGIVNDAMGPIVGATIMIKGTTVGTVTDMDGNFTLPLKKGDVIEISYVGYITQEVVYTGQTVLKVTLKEDTKALDEVVVIGYGVEKKVNLTGSISNVKAEDLTAIPTSNLSNTLAGRAPGMTVTGNSGLMGATSEIRLRGGFGDPLFVIDGVIRDKEAFDLLEPNEIDQLSFLKDAATASVYGSAAGNGVVLVTTKGGVGNSKPIFEYQGSYTFSKPTKELLSDMFTATDELIYQNRVAEFSGLPLPNGEEEFEYFKDRSYDVNDWIWQTPWNTKHSLSVTGGSEKVKYYVMGSFLNEEGSYENMNNKKYSLRSNITMDLSKYITMNVNLSAYQRDYKRFYWPFEEGDDQSVWSFYRCTFNSLKTLPFYSYADGTPANEPTEYPIYPAIGSWQGWNVIDQVVGDRYLKNRNRNMNGILSFNIDLGFITKGLSTKVVANYIGDDFTQKRYMTYQKNYTFQSDKSSTNRFKPAPLNLNDYMIFNFGHPNEYLDYTTKTLWSEQFNWFLNYNNQFGKHAVSAMAVFEQASNGGEYVMAKGEDPLAGIDQMFVFSTDVTKRYGNAREYTGGRLSWIGRFNYNFDSRYIAEFSFRYDGNTLFPKGKRWGFFPSVSAAWRISEEPFMKEYSSWLNNMKIRASYGTTGNDLNVENKEIAEFSYIQKYVSGSNYLFGNELSNGIKAGDVPNVNLTWATSTTYNGGLDFGFLENKLSGTFDYFYRKETDILGTRTVTLPSTYGQSLAPENYAARSWRGGELSLVWRDKALKNTIDYSLYMNLGFSRDQWDKLDESAIYKEGGNLADLSKVGMSNSRLIGLKAVGLVKTQEQVDELKAKGFKQFGRDPYLGGILFEDTRSDGYAPGPDGKIDDNDTYNLISENTTPRINYGFGGSVSWKGLTIDVHFQGVGKYDRCVGGANDGFYQWGGATRPYFPIWTSEDCWSEDNPNGKYPRVIGQNWYESGVGNTSFWLRNGAYLRLKNLNIGYDLPELLLRPLGLMHAQVFMNATNLFSISAINEFMDPEQAYYDSYPLMKSFTFGLNFKF